ncbi:MAG TPA: asparagine--tRNA ligase [Saprospirales bacterium]|nr:asparagine--tRNA ligase [Saprospirales bacterium]HAY71750.1 asparagine--tRNA ligase [Saprospirales bacterium]HRQ28445.1 asparagine--tRNA ligase [Saprospiraceae bacterium]
MSSYNKIKDLLQSAQKADNVIVKGWIRTFRNNQFIAVNDGTCLDNLQAVIALGQFDENLTKRLTTGAAVEIKGQLIESIGKGQKVELIVDQLIVHGDANPETYPLQPKRHSLEFLREIAHLRFRTNTFSAIFRIRHALSFALHQFFNERDFYYQHTPIITASDAEGAGQMFQVTTLNLDNLPKNETGDIDYSKDFFNRQTNLTVSGQLEAELAALALSRVYTFGPTFRAENSNTSRHLAEFWMLEPEVAFADLNDNMDLAEEMLKYVISYVMKNNSGDLEFLENRLLEEEKQKPQHERSALKLREKLSFVVNNEFERLTYTEAIDILKNSTPNKKKKFQYIIESWGADLQSEHERYLVEKHFEKPVILTDYPKDIKAFYMKLNDDNNTVRAMDILFPGIGEIVGGSQREERYDVLLARMQEMHIPEQEMYWYLDTRRFGTCPHAGFGLGFERLIQFVTGMSNIRDVIAFPRYPGNVSF